MRDKYDQNTLYIYIYENSLTKPTKKWGFLGGRREGQERVKE
jgi:hypothetical protein